MSWGVSATLPNAHEKSLGLLRSSLSLLYLGAAPANTSHLLPITVQRDGKLVPVHSHPSEPMWEKPRGPREQGMGLGHETGGEIRDS